MLFASLGRQQYTLVTCAECQQFLSRGLYLFSFSFHRIHPSQDGWFGWISSKHFYHQEPHGRVSECSKCTLLTWNLKLETDKWAQLGWPWHAFMEKVKVFNASGQAGKGWLLTWADSVKCRWSSAIEPATFHSERAALTNLHHRTTCVFIPFN